MHVLGVERLVVKVDVDLPVISSGCKQHQKHVAVRFLAIDRWTNLKKKRSNVFAEQMQYLFKRV